MRIFLDNEELFVYKDCFFQRSQPYFYFASYGKNTLVDKHFVGKDSYTHKRSKNFDSIVNLLMSHPDTPELKMPPMVVKANLQEQLNEFLRYWEESLGIKMDEHGRFYRTIMKKKQMKRKNPDDLFPPFPKNVKSIEYFGFNELLSAYNTPARVFYEQKTERERMLSTKPSYGCKRYACLSLLRTKKGFKITSDIVVRYPY